MRRTGTTQEDLVKRRARGQASRLGLKFRRIILAVAGLSLAVWIGSWLWLGGHAHKSWERIASRAIDFSARHGLVVQDILVQGRVNADAEILRALVNVNRGDPLLGVDPSLIRETLGRVSWVRDVHVERRLPNTLFIGLEERTPLALWQHKNKLRLIDSEGVVLADKDMDRFSGLLIVVGEDAPKEANALMKLLAAEPVLEGRIEAAIRVGGRRWDLKMKDGLMVRLPETDIGGALRRLCAAQEQDKIFEKGLVSIDVREPGRMTVRAQPGAAGDYNEYKADTVSTGKKDI